MVYRYKCITLEAIIAWIEVGGLASQTYCMCSEGELCSRRRFTGSMLQMSPCEPNTGVRRRGRGGGGGECSTVMHVYGEILYPRKMMGRRRGGFGTCSTVMHGNRFEPTQEPLYRSEGSPSRILCIVCRHYISQFGEMNQAFTYRGVTFVKVCVLEDIAYIPYLFSLCTNFCYFRE